ncbi:MAG: DUF411 domain-containing protein [Rhodospirillaceae bacterium]
MHSISRRKAVTLMLGGAIILKTLKARAVMAAGFDGKVFKSPTCGCCTVWVKQLKQAGIDLQIMDLESLEIIKRLFQVPEQLQSCHSAIINGYVIEGHVPIREIKRLLNEKPKAIGIAVPGMPIGSPGMEQGNAKEAYDVIIFQNGAQSVYAKY